MRSILAVGIGLMLLTPVPAVSPAPPAPSLAELSALLRPHLVAMVPPVLYDHSRNWGKTRRMPHAIEWHGLRPEVHKTPRNDGTWQKLRVTPRDLGRTLELKLYDLRRIDAEKQSFKVYLSCMATIDFEQQVWESGVRLYSGSTRARVRLSAWLDVENTVRLEPGKSILPDLVFRLRVTGARLAYNDFIVEHTAGVGGTAARWLGELMEGLFKELQPGLERRLLDRAGAALVRAADTREVRLGFGALLGDKAAPKKR